MLNSTNSHLPTMAIFLEQQIMATKACPQLPINL